MFPCCLSLTNHSFITSQVLVHAYHGNYLRIDVGTGHSELIPLTEDVLRNSLGGAGLGTSILLQEDAATCDPLSAEAPLVFAFSPLVGSPLTTSAKFAVVSKSPLTGRLNDSLASSHFAIAGKQTGCDAIAIVGRAPDPAVLIIEDGHLRLEPAGQLWGMEISAAASELTARLGPRFRTAVIGPAGERQVRYATISHDGRHAGRGGSGAVLGSKNIKAVAVAGTQRVQWAYPRELVELARDLSQRSFGPATAKYRELGTATNLLAFNRLRVLPTRNFQQGHFAEAENLAPETLAQTRRKVRTSCACCTIGCEHLYALDKNPSEPVRLEYENLFALGPLCGVSDADSVLLASKRCDELGIDTISAGGTIAFAMECVERGILDAPWLQFGDGLALLRAIEQIATKSGLGQDLAEGSRLLAERIGGESKNWAPHVKGLEMPGYEPRALSAMALGLAVGTRGADHNRSGAYELDFSTELGQRPLLQKDIEQIIDVENRAAIIDSLILCKFLRGVFDDFWSESATMLHRATGWAIDGEELCKTAEKIVESKKQFNIAAGWTPAEDMLPERFFNSESPDETHAALNRDRLQASISMYNQARGWTKDGWPAA